MNAHSTVAYPFGRTIIPAEAAYFDGNHCAHVAARDEHLRLQRRLAECRVAAKRNPAREYLAVFREVDRAAGGAGYPTPPRGYGW